MKWIAEEMDEENHTVASRVEVFDADIGMFVIDSELATDSDSFAEVSMGKFVNL